VAKTKPKAMKAKKVGQLTHFGEIVYVSKDHGKAEHAAKDLGGYVSVQLNNGMVYTYDYARSLPLAGKHQPLWGVYYVVVPYSASIETSEA
jgi:hypothetical protein